MAPKHWSFVVKGEGRALIECLEITFISYVNCIEFQFETLAVGDLGMQAP